VTETQLGPLLSQTAAANRESITPSNLPGTQIRKFDDVRFLSHN
jgi:hypothetical protein